MNADEDGLIRSSSALSVLVQQLQSKNLLEDCTKNAVRSIRIPAVT